MKILYLHEITAEIGNVEIYLLEGLEYKLETEHLRLDKARLTAINFNSLEFEVEDIKGQVIIQMDKIEYIKCIS